MSHLEIPATVAGSVGAAITALVGALWRRLNAKDEAHAAELAALREDHAKERKRLEDDRDRWQRRWADEVKRSSRIVRLARIQDERHKGRVTSNPPPPDSFDDTTEVRARMLSIDADYFENEALDTELKAFLRSEPPEDEKP